MRSRHITSLVGKCINFANEHGDIVDEVNNGLWCSAAKEVHGRLDIDSYTMQSHLSEGFFHVQVRKGKTLLLNARGEYPGRPSKVEAEVYKPGKWEEKIRR